MSSAHPRRSVSLLVLVIGLLGAMTAGCGGDGDRADGGASGTASGTVRLLTYAAFAMPDEAKAEFERSSGKRLEIITAGDAGETLNRALLAEGRPEADVLFGVDNTLLGRALGSNAFEATRPEGVDRVPAALRLDPSDRLHPVDRGDVCVNADAEWYRDRGIPAPNSLDDLIDPQYRDQLVVQDPGASSPGLAFLLATIAKYGEDGFEDYWRRLRDNGVKVVGDWDTAYFTDYTVSGGQRPLVVSYASSPPAEVALSEGARDRPASKVVPLGCFAQIEFAGLLRGAADPEGGRALVDFLLSDTWQRALPLANFVFPAVEGTELPEVFTRFAAVPDQPLSLPSERIEAGREGWIARWRAIVG